jgi:glycerol-3-phosphate acyltransferase PlsX
MGAAEAVRSGVKVILFGDAEQIGSVPQGVEVRHAPVTIAKQADPVSAVRSTPEASVVAAAKAVASGEAQAFVSGGSTGSALAAGVLHIRRQRGIHRPALALLVPIPGAPVLFLDVGASTEVRAERLVQHAYMGAAWAQTILGIEQPRVALLSNGEESTRGTPEVIEANRSLSQSTSIDFRGNIEGVGLAAGVADVVVTDGFTGNVVLKSCEATAKMVSKYLKAAMRSNPVTLLGGAVAKPAFDQVKRRTSYDQVGGSPLLGVRGVSIIGHGSSNEIAIMNAIRVAVETVQHEVNPQIEEAIASLR